MKLIIMTKATFFVEEDKILTTLFEEGLENLHLYKPNSEPVYSERLLTLLSDEYYKRITVHDHFYLREEFGLKSIHLDTLDTELPYGYRGDYSCTCRSLDQLQECKKKASYVFLQNIFDSHDIAQFNSTLTPPQQAEAELEKCRTQYYYDLLFELFDISAINHEVNALERLLQEHLRTTYPQQAAMLSEQVCPQVSNLVNVAERTFGYSHCHQLVSCDVFHFGNSMP